MQAQINHSLGTKLFFSRVIRNPRQLGAFAPSSRQLGALFAKHAAVDEDSPIVELGGGTGSLTRALIKAGINPSRIYVVELDPELANYLKAAIPGVHVIQGDAAELAHILPAHVVGKVKRIVSGLPMINIPQPIRERIVKSIFEVMVPGGAYLQFTYSPLSSIDAESYQLIKKRLGTAFFNIPPATVWQYQKQVSGNR